jgi:serine/threonine-protein kinase
MPTLEPPPVPDSHADTLAAPPDGTAATLPAASRPASSPTAGAVDLTAAELEERGFAARYETGDLLGQGGMGEVHVCRDARIGRRVALKRIRPSVDGAGDAARARFLREARIQAQLEHPAVLPVYDLGRGPDGGEFFTMKRVRGRTLAELLDALRKGDDAEAARACSRHRLLTAFGSVCLAVDYAHARGVLHRDLKPANLMLGDFGEVYVLDWGLAKLAGEPEAEEERIDPAGGPGGGETVAGSILGTPGYAAPELLRGAPADARSDVYSLGAILFELLTHEPLHAAATAAERISDTLAGIDARASARAPEREVPPELDALCVRATALAPADRPASARELHDAVERFLEGDRDLQLRRDRSRWHTEAAAAAAREALGSHGGLDDRRRALKEVGRALALDPDNRAAAGTLVELIATPPREVPAEVRAEIRRVDDDSLRTAARLGVFAYGACLALAPVFVAMGVRSVAAVALSCALFAGAAAASYLMSRRERMHVAWPLSVLALGTAALGAASALFGPYILIPTILAMSTIAYAQHLGRLRWGVIVFVGCLGVVVPVLLEWTGVVPPAYSFTDGVIQVLPRAVSFPRPATEIVLFLASVVAIFAAALYMLHFQRALADAQRDVQLHTWQIRQLVSEPEAPARR